LRANTPQAIAAGHSAAMIAALIIGPPPGAKRPPRRHSGITYDLPVGTSATPVPKIQAS